MKHLATLLALVLAALPARAQVDARLLRHPDVSETQITFVYAGDVWVAPKAGGTAHRLSSPRGEESFPRFSPDGQQIAFSANYDGNTDLYVVPTAGGQPTRLSHHPLGERMLDWFPDGQGILFASSMQSGRQRFNQLWRTAPAGGLPEKLPVPYGEFGAVSPDGRTLAYTPKSRAFRTWKRYRGGWAADIWTFDLESFEARNVTDHPANDEIPMWHGSTLYFLSDRSPDQRYNIWAYDTESGETRQVTSFTDADVHFPAIGPSDMVFEAGGRLHLMDLATEEVRPVDINVVTDRATLKPRTEDVSDNIQSWWISPSGKRAVFAARGDLFSVPAEHGPIRNLTRSSGSAERYPAWSPDGQQVAFFSDASGEYELTVMPADGSGEAETLTTLGPGFRYQPHWSPDGEHLVFIDQAMTIQHYDAGSGDVTTIDEGQWMYHGGLTSFRVSFSPDSRWVAYSRGLDNRHDAVFLYDTETGETHQVTAGFYHDTTPVFDPDGRYLFLQTNRNFAPVYGDVDNSFVYPNTTVLAAVPLRADVDSPLAPRNDEEGDEDAGTPSDEGEGENGDDAPPAVEIDLEDFERRLVTLPPGAGRYTDLQAAPGKVVYRRLARAGAGAQPSPVLFYDLEAREEKTILEDADDALLSADGKKLLARHNGKYAIVDLAPDQAMDTPLRTGELSTTVDPVAEWRQIFFDAWRFQRDFFYDPTMHGVDWEAMREQYGALLDDAATRWDVNYILGELIGELNASHAYRGGGDLEASENRTVGVLGVDWVLENGAYRIAAIADGAPWDSEVRSPLRRPGVDVEAGDYVLAVNGVPLDTDRDPWAAFQDLAGKTVALTVNDAPTAGGAREVLVELLPSDTRLRHLAWIEANRQRVAEASDGRVGYVYVRSTGVDGQTELVRQFAAQFDKPALIIDERFNSGGQIPDRFIELLNRPALAYWAVRDGATWQWPPVAHFGPKVMLINGWSGSGGDAFPDYFKKAGLGPLVGERTWGGLIGISGAPTLVDGGTVTVPTFRMYDPDGTWFDEGVGVAPDVKVEDDPSQLARGTDPQLERAIQIALERLEANPPATPDPPAYEDRTAAPSER